MSKRDILVVAAVIITLVVLSVIVAKGLQEHGNCRTVTGTQGLQTICELDEL